MTCCCGQNNGQQKGHMTSIWNWNLVFVTVLFTFLAQRLRFEAFHLYLLSALTGLGIGNVPSKNTALLCYLGKEKYDWAWLLHTGVIAGPDKKPKVFTSFLLPLLSLILTTFIVPCQRKSSWTFLPAFSVSFLLVLLCVLPSLSHHVLSASHLSPPLSRPSFTLVFASLSFMPFFSLYPLALWW